MVAFVTIVFINFNTCIYVCMCVSIKRHEYNISIYKLRAGVATGFP